MRQKMTASVSTRLSPELAAKLETIARRCGIKRAALMRRMIELGLDERKFYGSLAAMKKALETPEGAEHIDRVLRGLDKPHRVQ